MSIELQFKILSQDIISGSDIIINSTTEDVTNTVRDPKLGEIKNALCATCGETKTSGCNGHFGQLNLNKMRIINPAFVDILNTLLKYYCNFCNCIKNPELIEISNNYYNEIITTNKETQYSRQLKIKFKETLAIKSNKCLNKNCKLNSSAFKVLKDYKIQVKHDKGDLQNSTNDRIYNMLQDTPKPFIYLLVGSNNLNVSLNDIFFHDKFYIPSNYIREPNFFDNMSTNAHTTALNNIVHFTISNKEVDLQLECGKIDNSKHINAYKKTSNMITLADQVNGTNKESIFRSSILARRLDNSGRAILGPATDINIGKVLLSETIMDTFTEKIYYNHLSRNFINDILNNELPVKVKKIVLSKEFGSTTPSKVLLIKEGSKLEFVSYLKPGDYIEITKRDGTLITHGRQPSLHPWNKMSAMAYRIPTNTIKIPICIEAAQNGDNDGDANAVTNPTSPAANIELMLLMNPKIIAKNASNQSIVFGLVQDQLIAIHKLYQLKNLSKQRTYALLGKYLPVIKNLDQNEYSGQDIMSLFIKDYITYPPYFENGRLILKSITNKLLIAQSYDSIFNIYSQLTSTYEAVNLIDVYKYLSQQYIRIYGFSVKASEVLGLHNNFNKKNALVNSLVSKINTKINECIEDSKNNKVKLFSQNDWEFIKKNNIDVLQNILLNELDSDVPINNSLTDMTNAGYKRTKDEIIKSDYTFGQQGSIHMPGVNGRISHYHLPGEMGLKESGYIVNSLLYGLEYSDYVKHITYNSMPKLITVTCGTTVAGTLGRKIVKSMSDLIVNFENGINHYNFIIIPCANFLKISGVDIVRVEVLYPSKHDTQWDIIQKELFDKIKSYFIYNNGSTLVKNVIFYINIDGFIRTFNFKNKDLSEIQPEVGLQFIEDFMNELDLVYSYMLDTDFIRYVLLSYLNPTRLHEIGCILTQNLLDYLKSEILYKIRYSLSAGETIGSRYGHSIQEICTQQTLSSFHSSTKTGRAVTKDAVTIFKEYISFSMKSKPNLVICKSKNKNLLIDYKNVFEFANLKQFSPKYTILKKPDENGYHEISISVNKTALSIKNIKINQYYKIFNEVLKKINYIETFWTFINITSEEVEVIIGVILKPSYDLNVDLLRFTLLANVSKGKSINENLVITKSVVYNAELEPEDYYELQFFIEDPKELLMIDTSEDVIIDVGIWNSYQIAGIFHSKVNMLNKILETIDLNLFLATYVLVSYLYSYNVPISINKLKSKNNVIKSVTHGDSNAFINAAFHNIKDKGIDVYASIFLGTKMKYGTGFYNMYLNINPFNELHYIEQKEKEILDTEIISQL